MIIEWLSCERDTAFTDQSGATALPGTGVWGGAAYSKLFLMPWKTQQLHSAFTYITEIHMHDIHSNFYHKSLLLYINMHLFSK